MHRLMRVIFMFLAFMAFIFFNCIHSLGYLLPHYKPPETPLTSNSISHFAHGLQFVRPCLGVSSLCHVRWGQLSWTRGST